MSENQGGQTSIFDKDNFLHFCGPKFQNNVFEKKQQIVFSLDHTMIRKQCEEKKCRCHGREEHRDNIHHWAEKLLEFA